MNISLIGPMGHAFNILFMTIIFNEELKLREVFDLKGLMLRVKTFNPLKKGSLDTITYPSIVCLFLFFFFLELFLMIFSVNTKNSENMNRLKTLNKMTLNVKVDHLFTKVHFIVETRRFILYMALIFV